jgi:hypothetical protein
MRRGRGVLRAYWPPPADQGSRPTQHLLLWGRVPRMQGDKRGWERADHHLGGERRRTCVKVAEYPLRHRSEGELGSASESEAARRDL